MAQKYDVVVTNPPYMSNGGMSAKLESAKYCTDNGIPMIILNGADPEILYDVFDGDFKGTYFNAKVK